jgi:hypothetical protein
MKARFALSIKANELRDKCGKPWNGETFYNAQVKFNKEDRQKTFDNGKTVSNFGGCAYRDENGNSVYIGNVQKAFSNTIPAQYVAMEISLRQNGMDQVIENAYRGKKDLWANLIIDIGIEDTSTLKKNDKIGVVKQKIGSEYVLVGNVKFKSSDLIQAEQETIITAQPQAPVGDDDLPF